ncbi:hypothetical protein [Microbacterium gorillae]|uniref:hypothetical protein n=1 Tax=Microbacterium gorillae TaxID=1231063 RepID=UPI003D984437
MAKLHREGVSQPACFGNSWKQSTCFLDKVSLKEPFHQERDCLLADALARDNSRSHGTQQPEFHVWSKVSFVDERADAPQSVNRDLREYLVRGGHGALVLQDRSAKGRPIVALVGLAPDEGVQSPERSRACTKGDQIIILEGV